MMRSSCAVTVRLFAPAFFTFTVCTCCDAVSPHWSFASSTTGLLGTAIGFCATVEIGSTTKPDSESA